MNKIFSKPEKIKFAHCDAAGIVFYPRYLEMLNELVEDWFEEALSLSFKELHQGNGVPTVDLKVQFKNSATLGDTLIKSLWVNKLGISSVIYGFNFTKDQQTILEGEATLVYVNISQNNLKSEPWPEALKTKMNYFFEGVAKGKLTETTLNLS